MTAAAAFNNPEHRNGLQPVDLSRHLGGLANLMHVCFGLEMDADGRGLVREMQFLSHFGPLFGMLNALVGEEHRLWPWGLGFVWVEEGQVVGSVSTQRVAARPTHWIIANVAVHPDHRRRGLALALMRATLDFIRGQDGRRALLQVDDENAAAFALYRRLGFVHLHTQSHWYRGGRSTLPPHYTTPFDIRPRLRSTWEAHWALAQQLRPQGLVWNRPLAEKFFQSSVWQELDLFFAGKAREHWVSEAGGELQGALTLETDWTEGHQLTLLVQPPWRGQLERALLTRGLRRMSPRASFRIEFPAHEATTIAALRELNFEPIRSLRWMQMEL